ncbi:MAG: DUF502 domain-containing protein [Planctomycetes bacterium]|nr:DUF502 domain-containing protein [Planctomycetota bacterium]MCB9909860.1 DUF502 domain-containing protein [Planctomycetota bacterium]HPF14684.1 DUF502 domain-containing protein [Planctomycetota bacterium]HRV80663.1 DUF502 domain-containing protein [Planctomycetota bacterium]
MRFFLRYFLRGLLVIIPLAATLWIVINVFGWMDGLMQWIFGKKLAVKIPGTELLWTYGIGALLTLAIITVMGMLTSNVLVSWFMRRVDRLITRLPGVKLIYSAIKDMVEAFVSERKKFDKPVLLAFSDQPDVEVIGFVTRDSLAEFGRADKVAVYVPQSYNFAANLVLVPHHRVTPIDLPAADVMAFVVSGGVSEGTRLDAAKIAAAQRGEKA